ncbi:unnamed protein product [Cyprideis torosa]|uniref:Uncharacterized protein n=1 Tax=Cyprideis torosa TaxID=163714 RepID=A0A7R8WQ37_9CRUS|nr:unnamed protein product [Cyprideis torosa]CAG0907704.1 unnamed protein product [Cyprideis torosa]
MNLKLAIVVNGQLMMHYDRDQRLPGVQRRMLDEMDTKLDQGISLAGVMVEDPDPMMRAQFVANTLVNALFDENDQKAAAMCSWLATRIPELQVVQAIDNENESKVELVFNQSVHERALAALMCARPVEKCRLTAALYDEWLGGKLGLGGGEVASVPVPGRPEQPELVAPRQLKQRKLTTPEGLAALVHAIAHIEFNAINLALDAVYRFRHLPEAFYADWLRVAAEEAQHFQLLTGRLAKAGFAYGDFPAHNGLWEMALRTDHDLLERMALVPRVYEARGLDVTPGMMQRLTAAGDDETVGILEIILREEIGHVRIGNRWYHWACERAGLEPMATFRDLLKRSMPQGLLTQFNYPARIEAGFTEEELRSLEASLDL